MKTILTAVLCIVMVLGIASSANAQLQAGSPEDKAFQAIDKESNPDSKATLLLKFEKEFPQSKVLSDVYILLVEIYRQKNDVAKVVEYGEKTIKLDPENITALMAVARNYAIEKKNLDRANSYAQKAVDTVAKLKTQPRYSSEADWKQWVDSNDQAAKNLQAYVKSVKP